MREISISSNQRFNMPEVKSQFEIELEAEIGRLELGSDESKTQVNPIDIKVSNQLDEQAHKARSREIDAYMLRRNDTARIEKLKQEFGEFKGLNTPASQPKAKVKPIKELSFLEYKGKITLILGLLVLIGILSQIDLRTKKNESDVEDQQSIHSAPTANASKKVAHIEQAPTSNSQSTSNPIERSEPSAGRDPNRVYRAFVNENSIPQAK
jgi:hypothetical protein